MNQEEKPKKGEKQDVEIDGLFGDDDDGGDQVSDD